MSYNYKDKVIENDIGSYQDKYLDYAHNWEDDKYIEKKKVKIIFSPTKEEKDCNISFEDKINSYIEKNKKKIKIIDIKYQKVSVLVIYEDTIE